LPLPAQWHSVKLSARAELPHTHPAVEIFPASDNAIRHCTPALAPA